MNPGLWRTPTVLLSAALAIALHSPAAAQYKWKDSRGQVVVSDLPPPNDVPERDILSRPKGARGAAKPGLVTDHAQRPASRAASAPGAASASGATASAPVDPELEARRKRAESDARQRQQVESSRQAAQRAENCRRAQRALATLASGERLSRINERGERVVLDDAARAAEADEARQIAAENCR